MSKVSKTLDISIFLHLQEFKCVQYKSGKIKDVRVNVGFAASSAERFYFYLYPLIFYLYVSDPCMHPMPCTREPDQVHDKRNQQS